MEREAKRAKFDCQQPRDPRTKMGKDSSPRSSSFSATVTSYNDSISESTSPVLDTAKVRFRRKPRGTRRTVSDSAFSSELGKLRKDQQMQGVSNVPGEDKNLPSFFKSKDPARCPDCNSAISDNRGCRTCSEEKLSSRKTGGLSRRLVDRFRELKRHKKPLTRTSDLKDAQIPDEAFVESVKMLDRACNLTPPTKAPQKPRNQLGLVPFIFLERVSSLEEKKLKNSGAVTHLSLDEEEDKEDDMFADTKDSAEALEELNEFSQWKYKPAGAPANPFHGFSPEELSHSREVAKRSSQCCEPDDVDGEEKTACLRGFPHADVARDENLLQNWKSLLKYNYPNSHDWENWFVEKSKTGKERDAAGRQTDEKDARGGASCGSRTAASGNARISGDSEKQTDVSELSYAGSSVDQRKCTGTPETVIKAEVPSTNEINHVKAMSREGSKLGDLSNSRGKCGVTTTDGCSSGVSEIATVKTEIHLSQKNEIVEEDLFDDRLDNAGDSRSKCGFSTAGGRPISVSKVALVKAEAFLSQENKKVAVDLLDIEVDNVRDSRSKCGFSTASGRPINVSKTALVKAEALLSQEDDIVKVDLFADEVDNVGDLPSKCGFSTASGRPIHVSEKALVTAEALLSQGDAKIKNEATDDKLDSAINSRSKCGFSTAGGRPISVSITDLVKAEALLSQENEKIENELINDKPDSTPACVATGGSHTVAGSVTKIPEAETLLSKDIPVIINDSRNHREVNVSPTSSPMLVDPQGPCGFSTARGCPIRVSEAAVNKAKRLYSEPDDCGVGKLHERPPVKKKTEEVQKKEHKVNFGFATAGGRELKVSEDSWAKSKALFDAIEEPCLAEFAKTDADPVSLDSKVTASKSSGETMPSGFSTANGRSIAVATEAVTAAETQLYSNLDNMESLDLEDFVDPVDDLDNANKRKFEEIDDDTPLRRDISLKRKRGRYVNDLQARKLFNDDEDEDEARKRSSRSAESNGVRPEQNLISEEVVASAAALLEDERSNEGTVWQINACRTDGSASPELGCEAGNKSHTDVSSRNLLDRAELEKVNVVGSDRRYANCARAASDSPAVVEENNHSGTGAGKSKESQEIQHESIPDDLTFDSQFSQDIQCSPVLDKFIAETMKVMEGRLLAASKQDETIRGKRRIKPESCDGLLYQLRTANRDSRITWKQLTDGIAPTPREISGDSLRRDLLAVTANSAAHYSFRCADFYGENSIRRNIEGIKVGDGAFLILDEKNCAGARECERAFLASPGVDPNLVPTGWVRNHYRWIVWKLASMDRMKFGHKCLPRMLTPDRVMLELKYRYDREIYRTQWPPLRRILERGEDASGRIVLCVSSITAEEDEKVPVKGAITPNTRGSTVYRMMVTDGWYSIATSIDAAMTNFIKSGKVREGTKLMICGAKAVNLDQGCSALEIPEDVTLRIYSNSVRRARWNTKLDYYLPNRGPMSLSLKSVKPNGGAICKLVVAVSRVYPTLYREKLPDGQLVFRNARCDEEAARAHAARYQSKMEEIYANAWSEFQIGSVSKKRRSYTQEEAAACSQDLENELRQKISSRMSECLPTPRDVTPVMKIRVAEGDTCALVTVWSTDRDTSELFAEGSTIAIYNAFASGLRANELQITAGRSTFVKREVSRRIPYPERIYTPLSAVTEAGFNPVYGEFDTIGIVSSTGPAPHGMKNFETVNLACPMPSDATKSDFLSVLFWQGVSAHGYAKILTVGSLVACSNLQWRRNTSRGIPTAYCTDRSVFSKSPRQNHLAQAFESLRNEIKELLAYAAACAAIIEEETAKKSALRTPGGTPYKPAASSSRTPGWSPRDLTSPIVGNCTTPGIDSRKASSRKRLEKLEIYGEAPKLPSIVINNSSRKVSSDFRSPVLTPVTKSRGNLDVPTAAVRN